MGGFVQPNMRSTKFSRSPGASHPARFSTRLLVASVQPLARSGVWTPRTPSNSPADNWFFFTMCFIGTGE
jgi:hypothetical protein